MSFYRIYRPKVLDEIDNATVRRTIELLLTKPKTELPHAYLLVGPRGTGKTTTARVIAKLFNCEKPAKSGAPCGTCAQCKAIAEGRHLDVMEIDAASNTGVDNIRDLRDRIALAPAQAKWKIYIIDEVHMLSTGAFNALLKTLEEPPAHAIFILATTDPQKIPATVVSRCQVVPFGKALAPDLTHALERIVAQENMKIDADALSLIVSSADGSFRDAVKALEQISFQKGNITIEIVRTILGISEHTARDTFLTHVLDHNTNTALTDIQNGIKQGIDIKSFLIDCLRELERRLVAQVTTKNTTGTIQLRKLIEILSDAYAQLRTSPIPELPLELAVVEYCEYKGEAAEVPAPAATPTPIIVQSRSPVNPLSQSVQPNPSPVIPAHSSVIPASPVVIPAQAGIQANESSDNNTSSGLITLEKLSEHWKDVIDELKPLNHSVAGVMRSTRPKAVEGGIVTIEAFYKFHQEKLSEVKTREVIAGVLKKLFGEKMKVDVVLGKK
ncbi:MAG: DNA polymerase III subunit gamma/tau [Patescibacteria group bacterium]